MLHKAVRTLAGLASSDPFRRIETLERIVETLLWRQSEAAVHRHLEIPAPMPQAAITGAKLYADREAMLEVVPKGGNVAEIGVWRGDFSRKISAKLGPRILHLIDIDFSPFDGSGLTCDVKKHEGDSSAILSGFPATSLDWIYIDGDHSYEGAAKDLASAHRALKPGGLITCNDYTNWMTLAVTPYGVARAVNDFVRREEYAVEGLALSPYGNHDLMIRKPR